MTITGHAVRIAPAGKDAVFRALTDIDPPAAGAQYVRLNDNSGHPRVPRRMWQSRSTLEEIDAAAGRFVHRSRTDDGNPSEATWTWTVTDDPAGSRVAVSWSLRPVTFWRRVLLGRIRARQLARTEVPASLASLATLASAPARRATTG